MDQPSDAAAWGALLSQHSQRHGRFLFRVAMGILRDPSGAEDACQQAFMKAWEQRDALRDPGALRAWLTRVVVNESFLALRRRRTHDSAIQMHAHTHELPVDERVAMREAVLLAMEKLGEPTRTVVLLRLVQGVSGNEVKAILGCSASEVSRRLHDGMEQLRGLLRDWRVFAAGVAPPATAGRRSAAGSGRPADREDDSERVIG